MARTNCIPTYPYAGPFQDQQFISRRSTNTTTVAAPDIKRSTAEITHFYRYGTIRVHLLLQPLETKQNEPLVRFEPPPKLIVNEYMLPAVSISDSVLHLFSTIGSVDNSYSSC